MTLTELFSAMLRMSLTAAAVIAAIGLARLPLSRAPKAITCGLWFVALFRLLCPVSFQSSLSLFGLGGGVRQTLFDHSVVVPGLPVPAAAAVVPPAPAASAALPDSAVTAVHVPSVTAVLAFLWAAGAVGLILYGVVSFILLKRKIKTSVLIESRIYETDRITTPFVCGIIKPRIYLPAGLNPDARTLILAHETAHITRRDYLVKPLWFLAVCLHWFNPLVWLAFVLVGRDMELRCDEAVIRRLGDGVKADYSSALLALSAPRTIIAATPLAFGEGPVFGRIKKVLNFRKPVTWVVLVALAAAVTLTVILAANPKTEEADAPDNPVTTAASPDERNLTAEYLGYKTDYVGDNVKVGGILSLLDYPSGFTFDHFELQTAAEPYGVTVFLSGSDGKAFDSTETRVRFMQNAAILMSLVKNADFVHFKAVNTDDAKIHTFAQKRDTINAIYGPDVCAHAETAASFSAFLKLLRTEASEAGAPSSDPAETSYGYIKYGPEGVVLSMSPQNAEGSQLAEDIITNAMLKSAAWPAVDLSALDEYYEIIASYSDGSRSMYYAFVLDERACLQMGREGQYSMLDDGLFSRLQALMDGAQTSAEVERNLTVIMSSPLYSSRPGDYIAEHPMEYETILKMGDAALSYMLSCFENGEGDTLKGHIMMALCSELLGPRNNLAGQTLTPSQWYAKLDIVSETALPDYVYTGDDQVLKLVYATETEKHQSWGGGFTVVAVHLFGSYEEDDTLKVIVTTYAAGYHLYGGRLEAYTGSVIPAAITYTKNADGSYALTDYTQAEDGSHFAPSIHAFCTMPVSGKTIPGLSEEVLEHYGHCDDLMSLQNSNLKELLRQNGLTDIALPNA